MATLVCAAAVVTLVSNPSIFLEVLLFKYIKTSCVTEKAHIDGTFETSVPGRACQYVDTRHKLAKTGSLGLLQ